MKMCFITLTDSTVLLSPRSLASSDKIGTSTPIYVAENGKSKYLFVGENSEGVLSDANPRNNAKKWNNKIDIFVQFNPI